MTEEKRKINLRTQHWILMAAVVIAFFGVFLLIKPYSNSIIMAFILSLLCLPFHDKIDQRLGNKPNTAAILSCILLMVMIVIPFAFITGAIVEQAGILSKTAYEWVNLGKAKTLLDHPYIQKVITAINRVYPFEEINTEMILKQAGGALSKLGSGVFNISAKLVGNATQVLTGFVLMLFVLFFLLRDHESLIEKMRHIIPLSRSQEDRLLNEIENVAKSAMLGSFVTALVQGIVGGFAMWLVGFPGLFWGMMMGFCSFIPMIGTALIWLPAAIYLLLTHELQWGIFLIAWGVIVIGSIDNFVRPMVMQGNSGMNTLMIFFSLIGGLQVFGLLGLIYGPIIFGLALALFSLYEIEFEDFLKRQDDR